MGKLYTQWVLKHCINLHFGFTREGGDNKEKKKIKMIRSEGTVHKYIFFYW